MSIVPSARKKEEASSPQTKGKFEKSRKKKIGGPKGTSFAQKN